MVALLPVSSLLASDTAALSGDEEITRYLREAQFASSYRHGIEVFVAKSGRSNSALRAILTASDEEIITAVLPAYRQELTAEQARALADFYASDVGKAMTRQQVASIDNPGVPLNLTKSQQRSLTDFMATDAGQAALRTNQKAFLLKVNQCIGNAFNVKESSGK
nr:MULTISPECIES: DUF2059 domain-containing protein [unclassified Dyella]